MTKLICVKMTLVCTKSKGELGSHYHHLQMMMMTMILMIDDDVLDLIWYEVLDINLIQDRRCHHQPHKIWSTLQVFINVNNSKRNIIRM